MKATQFLFYLLLLICALNTTHNAVYNQCILYMNQDLMGTSYQLKLTLSVYFCAIFFVRCFIGMVADNCSGKKCLLSMLLVAIGGHVLACCATHIHVFILARFIQGLGLGGGQVMGLVLLMRLFLTKSRSSIIAAEQVFFSIASVCLPIMGHLFSAHLTWRFTYVVYFSITTFAVLYLCLFQPREPQAQLSTTASAEVGEAAHRAVLWRFKFLAPVLMSCFSISAYILWGGYFSLLIRHYHIPWSYLLLYQLIPILPYFLFSLLFKRLTAHLSSVVIYRRILTCQSLVLLSIIMLFFWDKSDASFKFMLLVPIILHNISGAFFRPLMQEKALNSVPNSRLGAASSFISICQVGINAVFAIIINCMHNFLPTFVGIELFITMVVLLYLIMTYRRLKVTTKMA